jgi:mono/diheme cytochrome c family protein
MKNILRQGVFFAFFIVCVSMLIYFEARAKADSEKFSPAAFDAAQIYKNNCASCHGKDGRAKSLRGKFLGARNLTDAGWQTEVSDERIFNSITNGRKKMPAFSKKLSSEEINSLVAYVRGLKK